MKLENALKVEQENPTEFVARDRARLLGEVVQLKRVTAKFEIEKKLYSRLIAFLLILNFVMWGALLYVSNIKAVSL
ncbi:hypothetical protein [Acinetobacter tandoii]